MKLSQRKLKQIIKEEISRALKEQETKLLRTGAGLTGEIDNIANSRGGFASPEIRKKFIRAIINTLKAKNRETGKPVLPIPVRMLKQMMKTVEGTREGSFKGKAPVAAREEPNPARAGSAVGTSHKTTEKGIRPISSKMIKNPPGLKPGTYYQVIVRGPKGKAMGHAKHRGIRDLTRNAAVAAATDNYVAGKFIK
jgi:hypothetical protein